LVLKPITVGFLDNGAEGNQTPVRTYIQCISTVIAVLSSPPYNAHKKALSFSSFIYTCKQFIRFILYNSAIYGSFPMPW
jgi:hypothetical protein